MAGGKEGERKREDTAVPQEMADRSEMRSGGGQQALEGPNSGQSHTGNEWGSVSGKEGQWMRRKSKRDSTGCCR